VIQEIFGVNSHIRKLTDQFAAGGYTAIAPSLFDRVRRGIELGYTAADMQEGSGYVKQLDPEATRRDLAAALAVVKHSGRAGAVGYCWGGSLAYLAAGQLPLACAVVYYGRVMSYLDQKPRCPVMYHYGTGIRASRSRTSSGSVRPTRRRLSIRTRVRVTASTASNAPATTRRPRRWHARARSNSLPVMSAAAPAAQRHTPRNPPHETA